jgi:hypothetical protein
MLPNILQLSIVSSDGTPYGTLVLNINVLRLCSILDYIRSLHPNCVIIASTTDIDCVRCKAVYVKDLENVKSFNNMCKYISSKDFSKFKNC